MSSSSLQSPQQTTDSNNTTPTTSPERPNTRRGRHRGQPRSRQPRGRRSRGRGRGQGRLHETGRNDITRDVQAQQLRSQREHVMRDRIDNMSEQEVRSMLLQVALKNPSLVFNMTDPPTVGYHPPPTEPGHTPDWCTCGRCREMPSEKERLCCGCHAPSCVSILPDLDLFCLDEGVLHLGRTQRNDMLAATGVKDHNASNRFQGYLNFVYWRHGRLGATNRRVIPSCCVWRMRDRFPDPYGHYTGFFD